MKNGIIISVLLATTVFTSCNSYNQVLKTTDVDYKYEAAKEYYMAGQYTRSYQLLEELIMRLRGTSRAEESLFMLCMCYYNMRDYETSALYFDRYTSSYVKGQYAELARFYAGKALYMQSPDSRLDQSPTYEAISKFQDFLNRYPYSELRGDATVMVYELQDRLAQKEFDSAQLYYNLGSYIGNCAGGGSNYEACIITAENALKTFPYTSLREELTMMILRCRHELAQRSVEEKQNERYRATIDDYYGFKNEFPESRHIREAEQIFRQASAHVKTN